MAEKRALNPSGASSACEHRHVGRQRRVERLGRLRGGRAARHLDARDLPGRVHARVGPPRDGEPVPAARIDHVERLAERRPRRFAGRAAAPSRGTSPPSYSSVSFRSATAAGSTTRSRSPAPARPRARGRRPRGRPRSAGLDRLRGARGPDLAVDPDLARGARGVGIEPAERDARAADDRLGADRHRREPAPPPRPPEERSRLGDVDRSRRRSTSTTFHGEERNRSAITSAMIVSMLQAYERQNDERRPEAPLVRAACCRRVRRRRRDRSRRARAAPSARCHPAAGRA